MKRLLNWLFCAALALSLAACSDDDEGEGVLTDPGALVGKWQLVKTIDHYQEDGQWHDGLDYDVNEFNNGDLFFEIYKSDGTRRFENYSLNGTLWNSGTDAWRYENGIIYIDDAGHTYPYEVIVLTETKLVTRDHDGDGEYEEDTFVRIE